MPHVKRGTAETRPSHLHPPILPFFPMAPTSLPDHYPSLILQYISQLSAHLPPHLLSTALLQRHHFLSISPADPVEYLCWPAPNRSRVIALLDAPLMEQPAGYPVRYVSDGTDTFAHVSLGAGGEIGDTLRLVFCWEEKGGWKYHDAGLMPFPAHAQPSLETTAAIPSPQVSASLEFIVEGASPRCSDDDSDDDDAYWGSYGAYGDGSDDSHLPMKPRDSKRNSQNEDAYWAQYASVQGKASDFILVLPP